jgi:hypothetical protein
MPFIKEEEGGWERGPREGLTWGLPPRPRHAEV